MNSVRATAWRKHHERKAPVSGTPDCQKTRFAGRIDRVGRYQGFRVGKYMLDFADRNAVPPTFSPVARVPFESGKGRRFHGLTSVQANAYTNPTMIRGISIVAFGKGTACRLKSLIGQRQVEYPPDVFPARAQS